MLPVQLRLIKLLLMTLWVTILHSAQCKPLWVIIKELVNYSISQEICTRLLHCCALLWLHIWLIFPYPSGLLHWHCGNLTIAPVPAKQPWWIWMNTSCEFIMNDCITTTKQSTTQPCAYFLEYTVNAVWWCNIMIFISIDSLITPWH